MRYYRWLLTVAVAAGLVTGAAPLGFANEAPESEPDAITMRGETMKVWPMDNLRARGFDIPDIPRDKNAFWVYLDAVNAYKDLPQDLRDVFDYAVQTAWPKGHDEKLRQFLRDPDNQKALRLARKAATFEKCQIYYFGNPEDSVIAILLPSLSSFRQLSKLLVVDGRRLEDEGAYDLALLNYEAVMRMAQHTGNGITLIENLVGIAIWALGDRAVEQMTLRQDLSKDQLEDIADLLDRLGPAVPTTRSGLRNEKTFGLLIVDELTARPFDLLTNLQNFGMGGGKSFPGDDGWSRLETRIGKLFLPDRTIKAHMASFYDECIERGQKPAYLGAWTDADDEQMLGAIPQWDVVAHMLLPSLSRATVLSERCRMQMLATRLTVALRIFTIENKGRPPSRLAELRDLVSSDDLIDPFSGKDFVYVRHDVGWSFYSFSDNLVDDRGAEGDKPFDLDYVVHYPPAEVEAYTPPNENDGTQ